MGLYITNDTWTGGYGSFHKWRREIALLEGIPLDLMEGFFGTGPVNNNELIIEVLEKSGFTKFLADVFIRDYINNLPIKWESLKRNPLHKLLYHCDCGGYIPNRQLKGIYERLEYLLCNRKEDMTQSCIDRTEQFIEGCKKTYLSGERLEFM